MKNTKAQTTISIKGNKITYTCFLLKRIDTVIDKMENDKIELENITDLHEDSSVQGSAKRFLKWNNRILQLLYRFRTMINSNKSLEVNADKISKDWSLLMERQSIIRKRYFLLILKHSITTNFTPLAIA